MDNIVVTVGHTVNYSIEFLDAAGNPMLVTPTPDSPGPVWSNTAPTVDTLTGNGLTATDVAVAAGSDTISVSLSVGGTQFSAQIAETVNAAPQVLTSIKIIGTVS